MLAWNATSFWIVFHVFLKEVQGTATLGAGGANGPDKPTLAIPTNLLLSLEKTK